MAGEVEGTIWEELRAPFPKDSLKWRVGATSRDKTRCMALAYMDARMVMRRLDDVVGEANWSTNVFMASDGRCVCKLTIVFRADGIEVERSDASGFTQNGGRKGFGYGDMVKGATSEAFKRAAAQFGIGRYLYDLEAKWVPYDERTKQITAVGLDMLGGGVMDETAPPAEDTAPVSNGATSHTPRPKPGSQRRDGTPRGDRPFIDGQGKKALYRANFQAIEKVHGKEGAEELTTNAKFGPVNFATQQLGADRIDNLFDDQIEDAEKLIKQWGDRYAPQAAPVDGNDEPFPVHDGPFEL